MYFKRRSGVLPGRATSFDLGRAMAAALGFVQSKLYLRDLPDSLACVGTLGLEVKEMVKCGGGAGRHEASAVGFPLLPPLQRKQWCV